MEWLVAQERAADVVNAHRPPAQFGADRWASLVAAHEIAPHLTGSLEVVDNPVLEGVLALAAT